MNWEWDPDARVLYLPTWWRYNPPESVNNLIGNIKDLDDLPATPLRERFATNTVHLSDTVKQTFAQALAKGYPHPSPKPSPNPSPTQEQEQEQDVVPPAVEHRFEEFWHLYPTRNGKREGKQKALKKWKSLKAEDQTQVLLAVQYYATSELVMKGIGIKDPHRWLRDGEGDEAWRNWIEPERRTPINNGHGPLLTCKKRVFSADGNRLQDCDQPASPESRPTDPRCADHVASRMKEMTHAVN